MKPTPGTLFFLPELVTLGFLLWRQLVTSIWNVRDWVTPESATWKADICSFSADSWRGGRRWRRGRASKAPPRQNTSFRRDMERFTSPIFWGNNHSPIRGYMQKRERKRELASFTGYFQPRLIKAKPSLKRRKKKATCFHCLKLWHKGNCSTCFP